MTAARAARDAGYDGLFVLAVKTAGIFCRPSCPSQPKRDRGGGNNRPPSHFLVTRRPARAITL